jgi:hypothetical protein
VISRIEPEPDGDPASQFDSRHVPRSRTRTLEPPIALLREQ